MELLDNFHQLLRTFLPMPHHGLTTYSALFGKSVIKKAVLASKVRRFNRFGFSLAGGIIDHYTDGARFIGSAAPEKIQNGLRFCPDSGTCCLCLGFLVCRILRYGIFQACPVMFESFMLFLF